MVGRKALGGPLDPSALPLLPGSLGRSLPRGVRGLSRPHTRGKQEDWAQAFPSLGYTMPTTPLPRRAESLAGYRAVRQVGCPPVPKTFRARAKVSGVTPLRVCARKNTDWSGRWLCSTAREGARGKVSSAEAVGRVPGAGLGEGRAGAVTGWAVAAARDEAAAGDKRRKRGGEARPGAGRRRRQRRAAEEQGSE